ncbi:MAG: CueP family metal-binding protein [Bacillus sp. (in: firmicutes)]
MNRRIIVSVAGLLVVALTVYISMFSNESNGGEEKKTPSIKQLVHEYSIGNMKNSSASITSKQLIVTNSDESQKKYDLPKNDFFVSIAPYVEKTHPCAVHSLTGCEGEMENKEFQVSIKDVEGNVILDQTLKTQSNGFMDLWLPRDKTYRVKISHDGKTAESEISTFEKDDTCISTMQLTKM